MSTGAGFFVFCRKHLFSIKAALFRVQAWGKGFLLSECVIEFHGKIGYNKTGKGERKMPTFETIRNTLNGLKAGYALRKVSVFGSYANGCATKESDLDLLVEFDSPAVSLIKLNALKYDLEDALGLPVDVVHGPLPVGSMITVGKVVRVL